MSDAIQSAEPPLLLDVGEVSRIVGCSERTVWRFAADGTIPKPVKLGRLVRWRRSDIDAWLKDGCKPDDKK